MTNQHNPGDPALLRRAHDELTRVASALTDDELLRSSPCPAWTVDDVVHHLAGGAVMAVALLGGAGGQEALAIRHAWTGSRLDVPRLRTALALERAAFDAVAPTEHVDHPVLPMNAADLLGQRIIEYAVHTWDIRRAIDDPSPIDAELARRAWQLAAPLAPIAAQLEVFGDGPSGVLPPDAGDEARLLDLTGRRAPGTVAVPMGTAAP